MSDEFQRLVSIVRALRGPDGCPWDKVQTYQSLIPFIIEEAYELTDALESGFPQSLQEELGDVLLHVVMLSVMAEEQADFQLSDVIGGISEKMIRRHPHVFGNTPVEGLEGVLHNWETIKQSEKKQGSQSSMDSIPRSLPGLMQAYKLQKRAAKLGFDWPNLSSTLEKVQEEFGEVVDELIQPEVDFSRAEAEFGDLLFAMTNVARKLNIDPEQALRRSNATFRARFAKMEALALEQNQDFSTLTLNQQDALWDQAKQLIS